MSHNYLSDGEYLRSFAEAASRTSPTWGCSVRVVVQRGSCVSLKRTE